MNNPGLATGYPSQQWDWGKGRRTILASVSGREGDAWQEEPHVSPDGETLAAVVRLDDETFTVRVNEEEWEERFQKIWLPRFAPDGRLTALVMADDEWTLAVDGQAWEERYAFIWNTMFGGRGQIAAAVQQDMTYGLSIDGKVWESLYENANEFSLRADGCKSAGVVQVKSLKQADLETFRSGIYTIAVDGETWDATFMNLWTPVFDSRGGERVAAQARLNAHEYTIVVNGEVWPRTYNCIWAPAFDPATGAVAAPVRIDGRWGMAVDAALQWKPVYYQCWEQQWSPDGKHLWAIVAPAYGKFTIARDNIPWKETFPVVLDLTLSPDGTRAAALACHANTRYRVVVDGVPWRESWDMAYRPVFSPDGAHVAVLARSGGGMTYVVDNNPTGEFFSRAWPPIFHPAGGAVLLRGIRDNTLERLVLPLSEIG